MADADYQAEWRRLSWRSRRGLLELDLYLAPFLADVLSAEEDGPSQRIYAQMLEMDDQDLLDLIQGRKACNQAEWHDVLERIRAGGGQNKK